MKVEKITNKHGVTFYNLEIEGVGKRVLAKVKGARALWVTAVLGRGQVTFPAIGLEDALEKVSKYHIAGEKA